MITLHISGGRKMLKEALNAVNTYSTNFNKPIVLGVTVLTSLNESDFLEMGHSKSINEYVKKYAILAKDVGLEGIVCSPLETKIIKKLFGDALKIVTPGIRIENTNNDDQARFVTPIEAFESGSDFIVMGRPLINSVDPNELIRRIINY